MNLLGHNYIAYKILGHSSPYTFIGAHIPDFVPFLPASIFSFDEIHENHEEFLKFTRSKYPDLEDLPLSMMCHSVKYGADKYNREIDNWLLKDNEELTDKLSKMIAEASKVSYETARGPRLHNYLWCGVDLYLIKNNPENITSQLTKAFNNINYKETAVVLAKFYNKNPDKVEKNLRDHFSIITNDTFKDVADYTKFYSKFLSPLKENDDLNIEKGLELLEFIYKTFEGEWGKIITNVENKVSNNMKSYIN